MIELQIPYTPHPKQKQVHDNSTRFRVIAAGRRGGKTVLAINELIKFALSNPNSRSWYVAPTLRQAKTVVWNDPKGIFYFLPEEAIKKNGIRRSELSIELINGHIIELKGAENKERLRGVGLVFVVLDEYGYMDETVWHSVIRPMLADTSGKALFIGTPATEGSPQFHDLFKMGQTGDPDWKSWLFFTTDNTAVPSLVQEVEEAKRSFPPDIFKREFEADFTLAQGLVYDNFNYGIHVIPSYEPKQTDTVVGGIDPGLVNETAALLTAWDRNGVCRIFKEYYQKEFDAFWNGEHIQAWAKPYKVLYWIIDRAAIKREANRGPSVYDIYTKYLHPISLSKNDPGSVIYGVNEVKKLLHCHTETKQSKLYVCSQLTNFINEIQHYEKYKPKFQTRLNPPDKPRKYRDHLMDCIRNIVVTRPWERKTWGPVMAIKRPLNYTGY